MNNSSTVSGNSLPSDIEGGKNALVSKPFKGSRIYYVKNLDLAVCLLSLGIRLRDDPPLTHVRYPDGFDEVTFNFDTESEDGSIQTADMIKAFSNDMQFIEKNPEHPMSYAMSAIKNRVSLLDVIKNSVPYIAFSSTPNGPPIYVKEGTAKHKNCIAKGMIQVMPRKK